MRRLLITCCAILAGCGQQPSVQNEGAANNAVAAGPNSMAAATAPAPESRPTDALYDMPESRLRTECAVADSFPDRNVPPGFHNDLPQPQFDHYLQCVLAEARRDGNRVRLAGAGSFPRIGTCASVRIARIGTRFHESPPNNETGTSVDFDNGVHLVDYGLVGPVARSRLGDPVRLCVHALPEDCPAFDLRGIEYRARNLRTGGTWVMADSQHMCRGA